MCVAATRADAEDIAASVRLDLEELPAKQTQEGHTEASADGVLIRPVPVANQILIYWWCSPPRIGRQRIRPTLSTIRDRGESLSKNRCVRVSL